MWLLCGVANICINRNCLSSLVFRNISFWLFRYSTAKTSDIVLWLDDMLLCLLILLIVYSLVNFITDKRSQVYNFIKKETLAQVFSCKFCKIFKKIFLQNASGRLLLHWNFQPLPWQDVWACYGEVCFLLCFWIFLGPLITVTYVRLTCITIYGLGSNGGLIPVFCCLISTLSPGHVVRVKALLFGIWNNYVLLLSVCLFPLHKSDDYQVSVLLE